MATHLVILLFILTACTAPALPRIAATQSPAVLTAEPSIVRNSTPTPASSTVTHCTPTFDDGVSPTYQPNAPVRTVVGHGHILSGVVRSSRDCAVIANAKIELWPQYAGESHPDSARATIFTDSTGRYRFECDPPEHIHLRLSAPGYRSIGNNSYHPNGKAEGKLDLVLVPDTQ